ncbi:MAG TPA: 4-alpha-glucanotransferase [Acidobacteriota bacterium]|nr:4-alpha-glucanotransferase [Acidobacteriota bacterium]
MNIGRSSGILLHPTSLPGSEGIGSLGTEAFDFVDFLVETHQRVWQVLPLGPTGYGDSPYQCFSAFAGNPLLINLEKLATEGSLCTEDLRLEPAPSLDQVDYGSVIPRKQILLRKAFEALRRSADVEQIRRFEAYCGRNSSWLEDFALFMAAKELHGGIEWTRWDPSVAARHPDALAKLRRELALDVDFHKYCQYQFFKQWEAVKTYANARAIKIIGDVPIFVAHDSADVWSNREMFDLASDGSPRVQAGVPPDYFSASGQLWGNPLYRWEDMARGGFDWWVERIRAALSQVDMIRLDHFRGFEAYYEVDGKAVTAAKGRWVKGPGAALFDRLEEKFGRIPAIAENLGVITPAVEELRTRFGLPGMAILQFAFGTDPQGPDFRPHNYPRDRVVYTGTHDNDTIVGWWTSADAGSSTRALADVEREREFALKYLAADGKEIHWAFIRAALASVAQLAIIPLQDVLGLGSEARMNTPNRPSGNWRWRFKPGAISSGIRARLSELTALYDR